MDSEALVLFPEFAQTAPAISRTGLLPSQMIRSLIGSGQIIAERPVDEAQIQPASLDLRLGPVAHRVRASFLPGRNGSVSSKVRDLFMSEVSLENGALLEKGCVYIIKLEEQLRLPQGLGGKANPKSSTGRLDIFTRLITDYGEEFERVAPGYAGPLYVEVVPRTFSVIVRQDLRLNQLRLIRGISLTSDGALTDLDAQHPLVFSDREEPIRAQIERGLKISVSLATSDNGIVAYAAKRNAPAINLEKVGQYRPTDFWEAIESPPGRLILNPGDFYVLASRERVRVPASFAAEMVPFDPSVGEFRIHYAGFFDPGFGDARSDARGTPAVLEVRAHEVPFCIEHGQVVGRLLYLRLLQTPDKVYGANIGSSYQNQGLTLSKHFTRTT